MGSATNGFLSGFFCTGTSIELSLSPLFRRYSKKLEYVPDDFVTVGARSMRKQEESYEANDSFFEHAKYIGTFLFGFGSFVITFPASAVATLLVDDCYAAKTAYQSRKENKYTTESLAFGGQEYLNK